jgi:hypothetical protein
VLSAAGEAGVKKKDKKKQCLTQAAGDAEENKNKRMYLK